MRADTGLSQHLALLGSCVVILFGVGVLGWSFQALVLALWLEAAALLYLGFPAYLVITASRLSRVLTGLAVFGLMAFWFHDAVVSTGVEVVAFSLGIEVEGMRGIWEALTNSGSRPPAIWSIALLTLFAEGVAAIRDRRGARAPGSLDPMIASSVRVTRDVLPVLAALGAGLLFHHLSQSDMAALSILVIARIGAHAHLTNSPRRP